MIDIEDLTENTYNGDKSYLVKCLLMGIPSKIKISRDGIEAKSDSYYPLSDINRILKRIDTYGFKDRSIKNGDELGSGIKYSFIDDLGTKLRIVLAYTEETKDTNKLRLKLSCY